MTMKTAAIERGVIRLAWCVALAIAPVVPHPGHAAAAAEADGEAGFVSLFNGQNLDGWIGDVKGYVVEDGKLVCRPGGNLYTQQPFADFVLRFEFKLTPGANNGLGIRTPTRGDAAYVGMELQILDDSAEKYARLEPWQFHGSIYGLVPAERGHLNPVGEWNVQEVTADGPRIKVVLNGATIVDADLDQLEQTPDIHDVKQHPGMRNKSGHVGLLGHGSVVEFRNIRIRDLSAAGNSAAAGERSEAAPADGAPADKAAPPDGFAALFNGRDLVGWKGLVGNPKQRAEMSPDQLAAAQQAADERMRQHWKAVDGVLVFDGKGDNICTAQDYGDFELWVDWKIEPKGDSGIYLRGSPQVQIWDARHAGIGSGGLYNNQKHPSQPLVMADHPVGQWNTFYIKMVGERVTVKLNGQLVVDDTALENYWDRAQPIYPRGQIELQNHGNTLWFRNIFLRELPAAE